MLYIGCVDRDQAAEVRRAIEKRGLTSHMNDTKWRALCTAIAQKLPFPPSYQEKLVLEETPGPEIEVAPYGWGDWGRTPEASMGIFIEWLKVAPRTQVHRGRLVAPRIVDCSEQFREILNDLRIPFREEDGFFFIYGHTESGDDVLHRDE